MYYIHDVAYHQPKKVEFDTNKIGQTINVKIKVEIPGDFVLPPNLFLINIDSTLGKFYNIQLYLDTYNNGLRAFYEGEFNINIKNSSILNKPNISNLIIRFKPTIIINSDVWNNITFGTSQSEINQNAFIRYIYEQSTYEGNQNFVYSNLYNLADYFYFSTSSYFIKPYPRLNVNSYKNLDSYEWIPIRQIFDSGIPIKENSVDNYYLEIHMNIDNVEKIFKFDSNELKNTFNIKFDYETMNFVINEKTTEINKDFLIPCKSNGYFFVWFIVNDVQYYGKIHFNIKQDFISKDGKYKVILNSMDIVDEKKI